MNNLQKAILHGNLARTELEIAYRRSMLIGDRYPTYHLTVWVELKAITRCLKTLNKIRRRQ